MPPGLVELIETRIGSLPPEVSEVVDVLAVAEPIQLDQLTAITDADSVAAAEARGLITIDTADHEVRVAHPLYAEVRRNRLAGARLRRLRGRWPPRSEIAETATPCRCWYGAPH